MKLTTGTLLMLLISVLAPLSRAQTKDIAIPADGAQGPAAASAAAANPSADDYAVFNATPAQEQVLRRQIHLMRPDILPLRIFFVPHWKYLAAARDFRLHVPAGYGSLMFTHLPSRTVFIDNDRYQGEDWLAHWIAHELGHLATNSAKEEDAERAAREFRKRFEDARRRPS